MKHCLECGAKLKESAVFCAECGRKVKINKEIKEHINSKLWFFILAVIIAVFNLFLIPNRFRVLNIVFFSILAVIFLIYLIYLYAKSYEEYTKLICASFLILYCNWVFINLTDYVWFKYLIYNTIRLVTIFFSLAVVIICLYIIFKRHL